MSRIHVQLAGIVALSIISLALLLLIGFSLSRAIEGMTPDGKVPMIDAGTFTAGLLALQAVVGAMRSIWESQERADMAAGLSNSVPTSQPNPPAGDEK